MQDMLVALYHLPDETELLKELSAQGIEIRRAMAPDKSQIVAWVKEHSGIYAAGEADVSFTRSPVSCFIATRGKNVLGYACYHATALDFFGPTRVMDSEQGKGIGKALLIRALRAMRDEGYGYAIIGGVGPANFYEKCVGAKLIEGSTPGIFKDFLGGMKD